MQDPSETNPHGSARKARAASEVVRRVQSVASRARALRIVAAIATMVALVVASVLAEGLLDAAMRFPSLLRLAILLGIAASVVAVLRRAVLPALRFRPDPVEIALRIERLHPELRGRLASAVEFERGGIAPDSALALRAVEDADERARGTRFMGVLRPRPAVLRGAVAVSLSSMLAAIAVLRPDAASIAFRRLVLPLGQAQWPARTAVESLAADGSVAARGRPLALRARLTKGDPLRDRVRAEYRVVRGGVAGDWLDVALALQPGGDFERLVEVDGEVVEFVVRTDDAQSEVRRVRLVEPATVVASIARIEPPQYARAVVGGRVEELGDGLDARSTLRDPVLAGSRVTLELSLSRPIAPREGAPAVDFVSGEQRDSVETDEDSVPADDPAKSVASGGAVLSVDPADAARWKVEFVAMEPARISLELVDADGIGPDEPAVYSFDVTRDAAPTATMLEPVQDESVVPDARISMRGEARDDIALRRSGIEISTRLGKDGLESLVFEELPRAPAGEVGQMVAATTTEVVLDLAKLRLEAGDSVVLRAFAEDFFEGAAREAAKEPAASGADEAGVASETGHGRVRSAGRILRVVGEEEFERQIRGTLAGVRRDAMRADERQGRARDALERTGVDAELPEAQAAVSESIERTRTVLEETGARLRRNGRDDGPLSELAQQALELAEAAQSGSQQASSAIEAAAAASREEDRAAQAEAAARQQEAVRADLEDLVELLDRDEDAWLARRRLDSLANRIRQLARETGQAAARSNGERREELSADARGEIDQLASRQEKASEEAQQVVDELRERAEALREADPNQARALEEAAKLTEDGRVREEMEQAAQDAAENRLSQSKEAQDRAAAALGKASEALSQDRKVRAEELARALESLVKSIRRMLADTEGRQAELPAVVDEEARREPLALSLGRLSQNTRGLATDARATGRESARVARTLDVAAGHHAASATALRREPFEMPAVSEAVAAAVRSLEEALAAAEEAEQRAEARAEDEKREELLAKYRGLLERQVAVRAAVERIVPQDGKSLGRRELIESRRLGTLQEELRQAIDGVRSGEADVEGSDALVEMHSAIDDALVVAKSRLSDGRPAEAIPVEDEAVDGLAAIVAALDESGADDDKDPFEEQSGDDQGQQGSGGGGGDPAGTVPAAAEIKLLKSMQEALARQTRAFDATAAAMDPVARAQRLAELAARQLRIMEVGVKIADKIRSDDSRSDPTAPDSTDDPPETDPTSDPGTEDRAPGEAAPPQGGQQ